jgi:CheY-like chemotaxis protein
MQELNSSGRNRILYVDGYEDNRVLLSYLLRDLGYSCVAVSTMTEALSAARSDTFDLYVLDSWYNDGTGIELCRRIRRFDQSTPIIFFSAWPLESAQQDAIRAGASAYLLKPALEEVLLFIRVLLSVPRSVSGNSKASSDLTSNTQSQTRNADKPGCETPLV